MSLVVIKILLDSAGLVAAAVGLASSLVFRRAVLEQRARPDHCRFPRIEHEPRVEPDTRPDRQAAGLNGQYI